MPAKKNPEEEKNDAVQPDSDNLPEPSPEFSEGATSRKAQEEKKQAQTEVSDVNNNWQRAKLAEPEFSSSSSMVPTSEERTWAMLAHLSILLNMVSGFFGLIAAIIIYFSYKDKSRFVAYHAMQSFIFQAITWIGFVALSGLLITFGGALAFLIIPLLSLFAGLLLLLALPASLIYGIIGAVKVNNGEDFRYWQVGNWVRDILEPKSVSTK